MRTMPAFLLDNELAADRHVARDVPLGLALLERAKKFGFQSDHIYYPLGGDNIY